MTLEHHANASDEWLTPPVILDRVLRVFGEIDLDPCAEPGKPKNVPADWHYTVENDGLSLPWEGRVFCNTQPNCSTISLCNCRCHTRGAPSVDWKSLPLLSISLLDRLRRTGLRLGAGSVSGLVVESASLFVHEHSQERSGWRTDDDTTPLFGVVTAENKSQPPSSSSNHSRVSSTGLTLGVGNVGENKPVFDFSSAGQIPLSASASWQKRNDTHNQKKGETLSAVNQGRTTTDGESATSRQSGFGLPRCGRSARKPGSTDARTADRWPNSRRTTSFLFQMPLALEPFLGTSCQPASNATVASNTDRPLTGAETINVLARSSNTCTECRDCFPQRTTARVFCNPPFSRGLLDAFVRKAVAQADWSEGIILLTPARPGSNWWRALSEYPACLTWGRIRYGGRVDGPPNFATAVWGLGVDLDRFADVFGDIGEIRVPYRRVGVPT